MNLYDIGPLGGAVPAIDLRSAIRRGPLGMPASDTPSPVPLDGPGTPGPTPYGAPQSSFAPGTPSRGGLLSASYAPAPRADLPPSEYGGLQRGAINYRDESGRAPDEWRGEGGGPRSLAQMEQDVYARGLMNAEQDQIQHGIDEAEKRRRDPMKDSIEARAKDLAYERLQPAGSMSRARVTDRGVDRYGESDSVEMGAPTIGEQNEIEMAREKSRLSEGHQSRIEREQAVMEYIDNIDQMRRDAAAHPEQQADLEQRLAEAKERLQLFLGGSGARGMYEPDPRAQKPNPLDFLQQQPRPQLSPQQ